MHTRKAIIKWALVSRVLIIIIQYFGNILIPNHNAGVFLYLTDVQTYGYLDNIIHHIFDGFLRWDSHYFMHLAKYGYTYEQTCAFLPLYPYIVYVLSFISSFVFAFLNFDSLILLIGVIVNVLFFVLAASTLYQLTALVLGEKYAFRAALVFCFNPASVFFSALYTESLYSYLSFKSMLNLLIMHDKYVQNKRTWSWCKTIYNIFPICLSVLTRSNGLLNVGFLVYYSCDSYVRNRKTSTIFETIKTALLILIGSSLCAIPFFLFQFYCYQRFCTDFENFVPVTVQKSAKENNFLLPGRFSESNQTWCYKRFPIAYSYVQEHYWNVGLFKYFELKQIPNFLLALPAVIIILKCSYKFFKHHPRHLVCIFGYNETLPKEKKVSFERTYASRMFVFVVHALFLTVFNVFCINVQVTTRILCSANPMIYWYYAYVFETVKANNYSQFLFVLNSLHAAKKLLILYILGYFVIGTVFFCNFLPWT